MTTPRSTRTRKGSPRKAPKAPALVDGVPVAEPVFPRETVVVSGTKIVAVRLPLSGLPRTWRGPNAGCYLMDFLLATLRGPASGKPESLSRSSMQLWLYGLDEDTLAEMTYGDFRAFWKGTDLDSIYVLFSVRREQPFFWDWLESCLKFVRLEPADVFPTPEIPCGAIPVLALHRGRLVQYVEFVADEDVGEPVAVVPVPDLRGRRLSYQLRRLDLDEVVREAMLGNCTLDRPSLPMPTPDGRPADRLELRRPRIKQ